MLFWPPPLAGLRRARRRRAGRRFPRGCWTSIIAWLLRENPTDATALGVRDYDDRDPRPQPRGARPAGARGAGLPRPGSRRSRPAQLAPPTGSTAAILRRLLAEDVEANGFGQRDMLFTTYAGWHQGFAGLARNLPFRTRADFESYLTRIAQYPRLNDQALAITANAVRGGFVLPCSVLEGHERTIAGVIAADPAQSRFYEPFAGQPARRRSRRRTGRRCRRGRARSSPT